MIRSPISTLWTLMRRELWESPVAFKWTPLGIATFLVLMSVLTLIIGARIDSEMAFTSDGIRMFADQDDERRSLLVSGALFSVSSFFTMIMVLVTLFYLAGSLYDDRKDRSILFWKSLPVSDTMTVLSKVVTACLLVPAMYLAGIMITQVVLLIIASFYALMAGVDPMSTFWLPAGLPSMWLVLGLGMIVQALWLLPIYAWLVFCSSWAPRLPILIAVAVPAVIAIGQHFWSIFSNFRLPDFNLAMIMLRRLFEGVMPTSVNWQDSATGMGTQIEPSRDMFLSLSTVIGYLGKPGMWIGIIIAVAFLAASIWFRRRATDN